MNNIIDIEEILNKHSMNLEVLKTVVNRDGKGGTEYDRLQVAIKEIVEAVVDKCAEEAVVTDGTICKDIYTIENDGFHMGTCISVRKDSITDVKAMIKYDNN